MARPRAHLRLVPDPSVAATPAAPGRSPEPGSRSQPTAPVIQRDHPTAASPEPLWRELLGTQLRSRRHHRGERLSDVAARAGVSPQYLSEIERGVKEPSSEMIGAIARALGTDLAELAGRVSRDLQQMSGPRSATPTGRPAGPTGPTAMLRVA